MIVPIKRFNLQQFSVKRLANIDHSEAIPCRTEIQRVTGYLLGFGEGGVVKSFTHSF